MMSQPFFVQQFFFETSSGILSVVFLIVRRVSEYDIEVNCMLRENENIGTNYFCLVYAEIFYKSPQQILHTSNFHYCHNP